MKMNPKEAIKIKGLAREIMRPHKTNTMNS